MVITSKFNGRCKDCNGFIAAGTQISWIKGEGARHLDAKTCQAVREAAAARPVVEPVTANAAPIAAFIQAAKDRGLKFPKARFLAPDGRSEMRLSVAGDKATVPGSIQVVVAGEWIGRIEPTGKVVGRQLAGNAAVLETLNVIAQNPAAAAAAYGRMMGRCSFCDARLTDDRTGSSVEYGYGPICARRYGLPHAPTGRRRRLATVASEPFVSNVTGAADITFDVDQVAAMAEELVSGADIDETAYGADDLFAVAFEEAAQ